MSDKVIHHQIGMILEHNFLIVMYMSLTVVGKAGYYIYFLF